MPSCTSSYLATLNDSDMAKRVSLISATDKGSVVVSPVYDGLNIQKYPLNIAVAKKSMTVSYADNESGLEILHSRPSQVDLMSTFLSVNARGGNNGGHYVSLR